MKLYFKQYGQSGEAIIILHGIFGMLDNWHTVAKALSETYRVFAVDARNHGQSPHSDAMSYTLMAEDVIELAETLGLQSFILMGHSMGGKTAMRTALLYPDLISKLIVVDIAPKAYPAGHTGYFAAFEEIPWHQLQNRKEIDEALSAYESEPVVRLFLAKNIDRSENGGFIVKSNIIALREAYSEIIGAFPMHGSYTGKTLFISGANSSYLKETDKPEILAHFPKTEFKVVPGAGHWVHADNPVVFTEELQKFLL